uniref:Uncharacterized protein n=1 Tax=Aegilops tauschii subsp. strangulata TaxID=200361 RepID=A0A453IMH6_AEGTS
IRSKSWLIQEQTHKHPNNTQLPRSSTYRLVREFNLQGHPETGMASAPARAIAVVALMFACSGLAMAADKAPTWLRAHATFYGGADASDT